MSADFGEINILLASSQIDSDILFASKNTIFPCSQLSALYQASYNVDTARFIGVTEC